MKNGWRRFLAMLLTVMMVMSNTSLTAFAAEGDEYGAQAQTGVSGLMATNYNAEAAANADVTVTVGQEVTNQTVTWSSTTNISTDTGYWQLTGNGNATARVTNVGRTSAQSGSGRNNITTYTYTITYSVTGVTTGTDTLTLQYNSGYYSFWPSWSDTSSTVSVYVKPDASITLNTNSVTLDAGNTATVTATVVPTTDTVTWTSDNESVATVSGGVITGVAEGTATITATTASGASATVAVTVNKAAVPAPTVTPAALSLVVGEAGKISGTETLTFASMNPAVATVAAADDGMSCVVTGVAEGTTLVSATNAAGGTAYIVVSVNSFSISAEPDSMEVSVNGSDDNTPAIVATGAYTVTATSNNESVATVDWSNGTATVTGVAEGTATITLTLYDAEGTERASDNFDVTVIAEGEYWTVDFVDDAGTVLSTVLVKDGETVTMPDGETISGYTFKGWKNGETTYLAGSDVTVSSDMTFTEVFEQDTYTVSFETAYGTAPASQSVVAGRNASYPSFQYKEGDEVQSGSSYYRFLGWQLNGVDYGFNEAVDSNITLTAKWEQVTCTITFYTATGLKSQYTVNKGGSITVTAPTIASNKTAPTSVSDKANYVTDEGYFAKNADGTVVSQSKTEWLYFHYFVRALTAKNSDATKVNSGASVTLSNVTEDVVFNALYAPVTGTGKFDGQGHMAYITLDCVNEVTGEHVGTVTQACVVTPQYGDKTLISAYSSDSYTSSVTSSTAKFGIAAVETPETVTFNGVTYTVSSASTNSVNCVWLCDSSPAHVFGGNCGGGSWVGTGTVYVYVTNPKTSGMGTLTVNYYLNNSLLSSEQTTLAKGATMSAADYIDTYSTNYGFVSLTWASGAEQQTVEEYGEYVLNIYYKSGPYTLTINYVDEDGDTVYTAYVDSDVYKGTRYSVTSPEIDGYTTDTTVVKGTVGTSDITVNVVYKKAYTYPVYYYARVYDEKGNNITGKSNIVTASGITYDVDAQGWITLGKGDNLMIDPTKSSAEFNVYDTTSADYQRVAAAASGMTPKDTATTQALLPSVVWNLISGQNGLKIANYATGYDEPGKTWHMDGGITAYTIKYSWTGLPTDTSKLTTVPTLPTDSNAYLSGASYTVDTTYTNTSVVYEKDESGKIVAKYTFSGWDKTDGTITASLTINGTWTKTDYTGYTVEITGNSAEKTYNGTEQSVEGYTVVVKDASGNVVEDYSGIVSVALADGKSATAFGTDVDAYTMGLDESYFVVEPVGDHYVSGVTVNDGKLTITPAAVVITADSATKEYDGTALTKNSWKITSGQLYGTDAITVTVTGSQTEVGESKNVASNATMTSGKADNYSFSYVDGTLKVTKDTKAITITSKSNTWTYDGETHTEESYTVTYGGEEVPVTEAEDGTYVATLPTGDKITITPTATGVKNVSDSAEKNNTFTYELENKDNYENQPSVTYGDLKITALPVTVTITGNHDTKVYDGTALTVTGYTAEASSTLYDTTKDFTFSGTATASQTNVGKTNMGLTDEQFSNTNGNFTVTFNVTDGYAEVTPVTDEVIVTITGHYATNEYDGAEHKVTGYDVSISNPLYTENDFTFSGTAEAARTDAGKTEMGLADTQFANNSNNFSNVKFVVTDGYQEITPKAVTVTADDKTKVYGTEDPDLTATVTGTIGDDTVEYTLTRESGENVGTYTITPSGDETQGNYTVTYKTGTLTITPVTDEVIVTITGKTNSTVYDGDEHKVTGYDVSISNPLYTENDFTFNGTAEAVRTDAGKTVMGLADTQFANNSNNFSNVKFVVTDGYQEITPKAVTVTADDKSKVYGTEDPELTATVEGTIGEDTVEYTLSRESGENVGTYTITPSGDATQGNYTVTYKTGTLTITKVSTAIIIKAVDHTWVYDGESHSNNNYVFVDGTDQYLADGDHVHSVTYSGYIVNVGSSDNVIKDVTLYNAAGEDVTDNYTIEKQRGTLTVTPRPVTLTSATDEKKYDGTPLTAKTVTASTGDNEGWVEGEGVDYDVTGSQTYVGSSANEFTYTAWEATTEHNKTDLKNYEITVVKGTLTVTRPSDDEVTEKTSEDKDTELGKTMTFTITATNVYDVDATITITEIDGVTITKAEGGTISEDKLSATFADVKPGATVTVTAEHTVTEADILKGEVENTSTAEFANDPDVYTATKTVDTETKNTSMTVEKTSDKDETKVKVGDKVNFTITITNTGNMTISNIEAFDALLRADHEDVIQDTIKDLNDGKTFTLKPGEKYTEIYTYTVTEDDVIRGFINNYVCAVGKSADPDYNDPIYGEDVVAEDEDDVDTEPLVSEIDVEKTTNIGEYETVGEGDEITYTITVTNKSNVTVKEITGTDSMAYADVTIDETQTTVTSVSQASDGGIYYSIESLAPNASATLVYTYTVTAADVKTGKVENATAAKGKIPDPDDPENPKGEPEDEDDTETETEDYEPSYTVVKTITNEPANGEYFVKDEVVEFLITVTNTGNLDLYEITVSEDLQGATFTDGTTTWTIAELPAESGDDSVVTKEASYTVKEADYNNSELANELTVTGKTDDNTPVDPEDDPHVDIDAAFTYTVKYVKESTSGELIPIIENVLKVNPEKGTAKKDTVITAGEKYIDLSDYGYAYVGSDSTTEDDTGRVTDYIKLDVDGKDQVLTLIYHEVTDEDVVEKTAEEATYDVGDKVVFTITVTNPYATTKKLTITEKTGNELFTDEACTVPFSGEPELASGATMTLYALHTVTEDDVLAGKTYTNEVEVKIGTKLFSDDEDIDLKEPNTSISVVKTSDKDGKEVALGEKITFTIKVTNDGNLTVSDLEGFDGLLTRAYDPEDKEDNPYVSEPVDLEFDKTTLAPGETATAIYVYTVTEADILRGSVYNFAAAGAFSKEPDPDQPGKGKEADDYDEDDVETEDPKSELTAKKTHEASETAAKIGDEIEFTITITNTGNMTISDIEAFDALLRETEPNVIQDTIKDLNDGNTFTLQPGEKYTETYTHTVTEDDVIRGFIHNYVYAVGTSAEPDPEDPTQGKETEAEYEDDLDADDGDIEKLDKTLKVVKTSDWTEGKLYVEGDVINYTITVTNTGNVTYTNVVVKDELTADGDITINAGTGYTINADGKSVTIASMAPNDSVTITASYTVKVKDMGEGTENGSVVNTASATGTIKDPDGGDDIPTDNDPDDDPKTDDPTAPLDTTYVVVKEMTSTPANDSYYVAGETARFTVTVTSKANAKLPKIVVTEELKGAEITEGTGYTVSEDGTSAVITDLAVGGKVVINAEYTITHDDYNNATLENVVAAKATDPKNPEEEPDIDPDEDSDLVEHIDVAFEVIIHYVDEDGETISEDLTGTVSYKDWVVKEIDPEAEKPQTDTIMVDGVATKVYKDLTDDGYNYVKSDPETGVIADTDYDAELTLIYHEVTNDEVVTKTPADGIFKAGDDATFAVTVTNPYDVTKTVEIEEQEGAYLTYADGSEFASPVELEAGETINLIAHHIVTKADLEAGETYANTITVTIGNVKFTGEGEDELDRTATVTIRYRIGSRDGAKAADDWKKTWTNDAFKVEAASEITTDGVVSFNAPATAATYKTPTYSVTSPAVAGYTPDKAVVSGKVKPGDNTIIYVIYGVNTYNLTIVYIYEDGTQAAPTYSANLDYGTAYSITSPTIDGYTCSYPLVAGTMPARDLYYTVVYRTNDNGTVIDDFDTPLGISNFVENVGDCFE